MNLSSSPNLKIASASLATLALVGFAPGIFAAESEYSGVWCYSGKGTVVESGPDVTTLMSESWGISTPTGSTQAFERATVHCAGYIRILSGKSTSMGSCRWVDSGGDTFTGEYESAPDMPGKWTFLTGTGKWKGVKGSGAFKFLYTGKPAQPGTSHGCIEHSGKYTLP